MRKLVGIGLAVFLSGCVSERQAFPNLLWPFGNPNAPKATSETAQLALGHTPRITPLEAQPGDVWPGPVQPMPTLTDVVKYVNMPLGQGYTPSLPSPYPPGQDPTTDHPLVTPPAPPTQAPSP